MGESARVLTAVESRYKHRLFAFASRLIKFNVFYKLSVHRGVLHVTASFFTYVVFSITLQLKENNNTNTVRTFDM